MNHKIGSGKNPLYFFLLLGVFIGLSPAQTLDNLKKAVVRISAQARGEQRKVGTGFIAKLEPDSVYLVTASHVVEGDNHPQVEFYTQPNKPVSATVVRLEGGNPKGLALLRVEREIPAGLLALDLDASHQIHGGETITLIGFPRVVGTPWAVTQGTIAGLSGRDVTFTGAADEGNSGGPLLRDGKVIGVITEVAGQFGYATPAATLAFALEGWGLGLLGTTQTTGPVPIDSVQKKINELLAMSRLQSGTGDYAEAWGSIGQALDLKAESPDVLLEQVRVARAWLQNIRVSQGHTFTEIVDKVLPCLYRSAAAGDGAQAADSLAHIGYANYLKWREGVRGLKIVENFDQALKRDPGNVYAHSMWGFWILRQAGKLDEANPHFSAALKSGREREFARRLQLAALQNVKDIDYTIEMIRVADDMRKNHEELGLDERKQVESHAYFMFLPKVLERLSSILPAGDHLATYVWLTRDFGTISLRQRFLLARLTEGAGDVPKALSLYRSLQSDPDFKLFTQRQEVEAGIKRCARGPA